MTLKPEPALPPILLAGVLGWPVTHSLSPRLHAYWLKHYNIPGSYHALAVAPANLAETLSRLPAKGFRGVNLTLPHKEAALHLVDHTDALARRIGAVNTIVVGEDGTLEGRNTDGFGFQQSLLASGFKPTGKPVVVLGAGGAARAALVALLDMDFSEIRVVNRTQSRAISLAHDFGHRIRIFPWHESEHALTNAALLVNATSLGLQGQPALDLVLDCLPREATVMDLVYAPLMTDLLIRAQQRGNKIVDGLGMLLHQARPAFAAWFGRDPDVSDELRRYVLEGK